MTLRRLAELESRGLLTAQRMEDLAPVVERYALAITPALLDQANVTDPDDPVLRQFIPDESERFLAPGEVADPTADEAYSPAPGIVHRHADRVLLKLLHACPVYCRFCFRRERVGPHGGVLGAQERASALQYISKHPEIREVIFTGGDPFLLAPRRVEEVVQALNLVDHVKILRWHTRVPVAAPERVTAALIAALLNTRKSVVVGVHVNHVNELGVPACEALARLADAGIPLLSQSVLLRGVNDSVDALEALLRRLVSVRVKPYYLHQLDPAPGTARFHVPVEEGQALMIELRRRLPAPHVPAYVRDYADARGKLPLV